MNSKDDQCEFCDEFTGGNANSFASLYSHELSNRTILEQDHLRIIPSLGQIVPGYVLLVPVQHHRAFADMPLAELKAAELLKTDVTERMRSLYGSLLLFEHGVRASDSGGCGISHAHMHIVPFPDDQDFLNELIRSFPFRKVNCFADLKQIEPGTSYLYYERTGDDRYVFCPQFVPSQYIRRLIGEALGIPTWDWRKCGREEKLLSTLSQLSQLLAVESP